MSIKNSEKFYLLAVEQPAFSLSASLKAIESGMTDRTQAVLDLLDALETGCALAGLEQAGGLSRTMKEYFVAAVEAGPPQVVEAAHVLLAACDFIFSEGEASVSDEECQCAENAHRAHQPGLAPDPESQARSRGVRRRAPRGRPTRATGWTWRRS